MNDAMNTQTFSPGRPARPCSPTSPWRQNNRHPIIVCSCLERWLPCPSRPPPHPQRRPQLWLLKRVRSRVATPARGSRPHPAGGLWKPQRLAFPETPAHPLLSSLTSPKKHLLESSRWEFTPVNPFILNLKHHDSEQWGGGRQTVPRTSSPLRAVRTCCRDPRPHAGARDGGEATGEHMHADGRPVVADQTFWKAPANPG